MKILFLMYSWDKIDPNTDSSLRLIHESQLRGHMVAVATVNSLTIREGITSAFCDVLVKTGKVSQSIPSFYKNTKLKRIPLPLAGFDVIFMRSNPPLDTLALNFLDSVRSHTFIVNDIDGLRIANNKLYTASFSDPKGIYIPLTHVSKNREYLERIFDEHPKDKMILKPLAGHGGTGVIVLEKNARQSFRSLLDFYIDQDERGHGKYVILQEYVEGAEDGDVRIMILNGEPIGAMRRVPAAGDVRSNVHAGGSVVKHTLTKKEKELCKHIAPKLLRDGLYFVGIDVIGEKLIEVNVLSPGGISRINQLNKTNLQRQVIDFLETIMHDREIILARKNKFRQAIDDAGIN